MPPNKPAPWSGVREATAFGPSAPQAQLAGPYDYLRIIDLITIRGRQAEDCLVLNVWTRAVKDNAKRPVLVSFHGGGFALGSGAPAPMIFEGVVAKSIRMSGMGPNV
jgi:para-nitrobenzyl esterase